MDKKLIILGMGNTLLGDDGVGIYVVQELRNRCSAVEGIDFEYVSWGGFRIIDVLQNYKNAIVIDAINTNEKPEGYIHVLSHEELLHSIRMVSFHDVNFATAIEFASMLNIPMPNKIFVYGIEVRNIETFTEGLTPTAQKAADECIGMVMKRIESITLTPNPLSFRRGEACSPQHLVRRTPMEEGVGSE
ncbi:MAG TPA: hydrogenase maturation protease [Ignavibacteria bacterium]|nr:hydrogenase maturation protease [Ignavibacteria bacterium]